MIRETGGFICQSEADEEPWPQKVHNSRYFTSKVFKRTHKEPQRNWKTLPNSTKVYIQNDNMY